MSGQKALRAGASRYERSLRIFAHGAGSRPISSVYGIFRASNSSHPARRRQPSVEAARGSFSDVMQRVRDPFGEALAAIRFRVRAGRYVQGERLAIADPAQELDRLIAKLIGAGLSPPPNATR